MDDPRCAFDLHALCAKALLQLLHQARHFTMEDFLVNFFLEIEVYLLS